MKPMFTFTPDPKNMVTEDSTDCVGQKFHGTAEFPCLDILCVECGWSGHFGDRSTDHFANHKCKLRTNSISTSD